MSPQSKKVNPLAKGAMQALKGRKVINTDEIEKALSDNEMSSQSRAFEKIGPDIGDRVIEKLESEGFTISRKEKGIIKGGIERSCKKLTGYTLTDELQKTLTTSFKQNRHWWSRVKSWFGSKSYAVSPKVAEKIAGIEVEKINKQLVEKSKDLHKFNRPVRVLPPHKEKGVGRGV